MGSEAGPRFSSAKSSTQGLPIAAVSDVARHHTHKARVVGERPACWFDVHAGRSLRLVGVFACREGLLRSVDRCGRLERDSTLVEGSGSTRGQLRQAAYLFP